jgi:hypothetical protein
MTKSITNYPLESALVDYVDYFLAGDITSALRSLAAEAGQKQEEEKEKLEKKKKNNPD